MRDETVITQYYNTLIMLDRTNEPALSPDYEDELNKKKDGLEKIMDQRKLWNNPLAIEYDESLIK